MGFLAGKGVTQIVYGGWRGGGKAAWIFASFKIQCIVLVILCSCNYLYNMCSPDEILSYTGTRLLCVLSLCIPHIRVLCEQVMRNCEMKE